MIDSNYYDILGYKCRKGVSLVKEFSKNELMEIADKKNIPIKKSWNRSKMIGFMIKYY